MRSSLENSQYSRHFNRLRLLGAFVSNTKNPYKANAYVVYKLIMTGVAVTACVSLFIDFYLVFGDFKKMTWNLCVTSLFSGIIVKNVNTLRRIDVVNKLRVKLHRDEMSRNSPEDDRVNQLSLKELKFVQMLFYGTAGIFIPVWLLSWYFSYLWGRPRDLPIPFRFPFDYDLNDEIEYHLWFCFVSFGGIMGVTLVLETELAMFTILIQISREYNRLLKEINKINDVYEDQAMTFETGDGKTSNKEVNPWLRRIRTKMLVKKYSTQQQQLIQYTEDFELAYCQTMLIQILVGTLLVIVSAMQCIIEYGNVSMTLTYQLGYIWIICIDIFLLCWFATRLNGQCVQVGEEVYATLWSRMGVATRKDLCMIIMRSQRPPKITSGKILEINLHAFMLIMKNIYSWLALFKQLV